MSARRSASPGGHDGASAPLGRVVDRHGGSLLSTYLQLPGARPLATGQTMRADPRGMRDLLTLNAVSRPALWLVVGRGVGFLAAFGLPLGLVRTFDQTTFGTYKQLFLIYSTLYGVAQLGVAESLYYFLPRRPDDAGRHTLNAVLTLALMGAVSAAGLVMASSRNAEWLTNPQ